MYIHSLELDDFDKGFGETLNALSPIMMNQERFVEIFRSRQTYGIITIVAEIENKIVGTASYFIEVKFIHQGNKVMHIEDVAVKHELQGQGIGKALMAHLENLAKLQGCYKIILDCAETNVKFYESCGFKKHEIEMRKDL